MLSLVEHDRGGSNRKWEEAAIDAYIWVNDVDSLYTGLRAKGASVSGPPCLQFYGIGEIEVLHLDGDLLTFGHPVQPAPR